MQCRITTDNEWKGKYELLEQQFKRDGISLISLGDNLPTGSKEQVGGKSFFKIKLKELGKTMSQDGDLVEVDAEQGIVRKLA